MTKKEINLIKAERERLWRELLLSTKEFGKDAEPTVMFRSAWSAVDDVCKLLGI